MVIGGDSGDGMMVGVVLAPPFRVLCQLFIIHDKTSILSFCSAHHINNMRMPSPPQNFM